MEKVSLLNKLKTLKQWQLQQQLDFSRLKENVSETNNDSDEENGVSHSCDNFSRTMNNRDLQSALQEVDMNIKHESKLQKNIQNRGKCFDQELLMNKDLDNWHMSGLSTVVFKPTNDYITASESEDEIDQFDIDGVQPLIETEDENGNDCEQGDKDGVDDVWYNSDGGDDVCYNSDGGDDVGYNSDGDDDDDANDTVIDKNVIDTAREYQNEPICQSEERPISSKLNGDNYQTFDQLVEKELQKNNFKMDSSTPVKSKKYHFLKRGEGLKRFQFGVLQQQKQKFVKEKNKKNVHPRMKLSLKPNLEKHASGVSTDKKSIDDTKPFIRENLPKTVKYDKVLQNPTHKTLVNNDVQFKDGMPLTDNVLMHDGTKATSKIDVSNDHSTSTTVLDLSFQNMLHLYSAKEKMEDKELDAFEALEEAAENVSLSSNSSLVMKFLGKQKHQVISNRKDDIIEESDEKRVSYDFNDESSWSDVSQLDEDHVEVEETLINDSSSDTSICSSPDTVPMKRIVSKRTLPRDDVDSLTDDTLCAPSVAVHPSSLSPSNEELQRTIVSTIPLKSDAPLIISPTSSVRCPTDVSEVVKQKLLQLENEIQKFKTENEVLSKLRTERENDLKSLRTEIEVFQREKREELKRIEDYKAEEMKKIKMEKKVFDKYQKAARAIPNKKERDEIKALQEQCEQINNDLKTKETRWNSASHRFRSRINELEEVNNELRSEIKIMEQERLHRWKIQHEEKIIEKKKEMLLPPTADNFGDTQNLPPQHSSSPHNSRVVKNDVLNNHDTMATSPDEPQQFATSVDIKNNRRSVNRNKRHANEIRHPDGKIEVVQPDESKLITFPNGTKKTISKDGAEVTVVFFNGDIKTILPDKRMIYFYADSNTSHTTYPDGLQMLEFPNKQIEKRFPDGTTEITFPDSTTKRTHTDGSEETIFCDGTTQTLDHDGVRTITFVNGQKEIHTKTYKRREYPNGTVKTVYEDGRQETKYSTGRLRVKDKDGKLLIDSFTT